MVPESPMLAEASPAEGRPARARLVWAVVVAGSVMALAVLGWTWRHPQVFPAGGGWAIGHDSWEANKPMYIGMSYEKQDSSGTITIHSVRAGDLSSSEDARVAFYVCTINPRGRAGMIGTASEATIHGECSSLVPAEGEEMALNATPRQQLVVSVTVKRPGVLVTFHGIDVDYSHGWQRGTQRIGGDIRIKVPADR